MRDVGLRDADDETIWNYPAQRGLVIVSKSTNDIAALLIDHHAEVQAFGDNVEAAFLALG